MAWTSKRYRFPNAIEVEEFHTAKYGAPGQERQKRKKPTPEQVEKQNQLNREKLARRKLRAHFDVNDYFTDLTYRKDARPPDMETAKDQFAKLLRAVRKEYKKRGEELKWMRNIEVGSKGAWHIHIIINRITDTDIILAENWPHGKVYNELMYEKGEFRELAAYITKTPKTDTRLRESSYSASRNLPVPEPEKKNHLTWATWKSVRIPKGWYLDPNSLEEGRNPLGYKYRHYTLLRIDRKQRGEKRVRGKHRDRGRPDRVSCGTGIRGQTRAAPRAPDNKKPGRVKKKQLHTGDA